MHILTKGKLALATLFLSLLVAMAFGIGFTNQQLQPSTSKVDSLSQQVEQSADQALRVVENDDAPLRILDAKVKEIPGHDFTKLTGKKTDLPTVCSVPEVRLLNSSGKKITEFVLAVRDPKTKTTRGIIQNKISIASGETYTVWRNSFVRPEWISTVGADGQAKARVQPEVSSEKFWISFAPRMDLFVTVVEVAFHDGSNWKIKEGGEIR